MCMPRPSRLVISLSLSLRILRRESREIQICSSRRLRAPKQRPRGGRRSWARGGARKGERGGGERGRGRGERRCCWRLTLTGVCHCPAANNIQRERAGVALYPHHPSLSSPFPPAPSAPLHARVLCLLYHISLFFFILLLPRLIYFLVFLSPRRSIDLFRGRI